MLNGQKNPSQCQMVVALNMIVGKWKPIILDHLLHGDALRFNELKNSFRISLNECSQCIYVN